jgi:3-deoxy-D-manno-octulosonate 8-phosphate phosphatase (KDO 8-P phosphatase)
MSLSRFKETARKAKQITAIFFDVDGVLTDGKIIYDDRGVESKQFNVKDGLIINYLKRLNFIVGIISGRNSSVVTTRAAELKLDFCKQGVLDKLSLFENLLLEYNLSPSQVAYIGDDINDLGILRVCGFSGCPSDAPSYIKIEADMITTAKGGEGAFREFSDFVISSQGEFEKILK